MSRQTPFFSIITPTYNRAHYLDDVLKSVQNQSFEDYEHIVIDDGSTDNTEEIVKAFSANDQRVRYFKQRNQGRSHARNVGLEQATGEFVCFLDSDDKWSHSYLMHLSESIKTSSSDFLTARMVWVSEKSNVQSKRNIESFHLAELNKIIDLEIGMNVCLRRTLLNEERFNEKLQINEDFELWLRILCAHNLDVTAVPQSHYLVSTPEEVGNLSKSEIEGIFATQSLLLNNPCVKQHISAEYWSARTRGLRYRLTRNAIQGGTRWEKILAISNFLSKYPFDTVRRSLIVELLYALPGGMMLKKLISNLKGA